MIKKYKELNESSATDDLTVATKGVKLTNELTFKFTNEHGELMTIAQDEKGNMYFNHMDILEKDHYEKLDKKALQTYVFSNREIEFIKIYMEAHKKLISTKPW